MREELKEAVRDVRRETLKETEHLSQSFAVLEFSVHESMRKDSKLETQITQLQNQVDDPNDDNRFKAEMKQLRTKVDDLITQMRFVVQRIDKADAVKVGLAPEPAPEPKALPALPTGSSFNSEAADLTGASAAIVKQPILPLLPLPIATSATMAREPTNPSQNGEVVSTSVPIMQKLADRRSDRGCGIDDLCVFRDKSIQRPTSKRLVKPKLRTEVCCQMAI